MNQRRSKVTLNKQLRRWYLRDMCNDLSWFWGWSKMAIYIERWMQKGHICSYIFKST